MQSDTLRICLLDGSTVSTAFSQNAKLLHIMDAEYAPSDFTSDHHMTRAVWLLCLLLSLMHLPFKSPAEKLMVVPFRHASLDEQPDP